MSSLKWAVLENIATVTAIAAIIIGVYALGGGGYGFWSLLLMFNLNSGVRVKGSE
jgi:hypothetical protein